MSALALNTILPPAYEALAHALNITNFVPKDPLSILDHIDGKAVKAWIQSFPGNMSLTTTQSLLHTAKKQFGHLPTSFPAAVTKHADTMQLASCFFGTSYLFETAFIKLPVLKEINPYPRKALAFTSGAAVTLFAASNFLEIQTDSYQLASLALRVTAVALGTTVVIKTSQTALRALGKSSNFLAKVVSIGCFGIAGGLEFLSINPLERRMPSTPTTEELPNEAEPAQPPTKPETVPEKSSDIESDAE